MIATIEFEQNLLTALRTAKAQCLVRVVQLSNCRVCGEDQRRFEETVEQITELINQLETRHVQTIPTKP